jgi:ABC-type sugar transport system substrate-binding protein
MEKAFVAQRVAKKLFVTEAAVDGALSEASELMSEMLRARKDVNASMVFADDAAVKMVEAIKALSEARTAMVGVHNELNEAKLRLGIRAKMAIENKPPASFAADVAQTSMRQLG